MNNELNIKGHEGRDDLAGEHKFGDAGQIILFLIFIIVWILDSFVLKYTNQLSNYINIYIRIAVSLVLIIFAFYLFKTSHNTIFKTVRKEAVVISEGVYSRVRHPMYLGAILLYLALIIFSMSIAGWFVWIIGLLFYNYIACYEEKILIKKYGAEYVRYMSKVSRWLP
ncbi:MAG: isoprenylcysteine carboxylmethyltransferase family protein [Candidatus Zixiibacteriota bacterium]